MNIEDLPALLTKIEELPALLKKLEDRAGEQEALRSTMLTIGTALADLLQLQERSGPDTAKAIAAASAGLKLGEIQANVNVPQPLVQIGLVYRAWA